jgi:DNA-binding transcriptional ArsR family regulator
MIRNAADLALHPVRLRIIQAFAGDERLTVKQLRAAMSNVPQATIYRHVNALAEAGILGVVAQRTVGGTVERVYALRAGAAVLAAEDFASASRDDHVRYFTTFVAGLLGDFARYVQQRTVDPAGDGVGYRQVALELSDSEFTQLLGELDAVLAPRLANNPRPGRRRRLLTTIVMPQPDM